jgi:D-alanyl-D-alanine carboxypeptidase
MTPWARLGLALGIALGLALPLADGAQAAEAWAPAKKLDIYFDSLEHQGFVHGSMALSERGIVRYKRSIGFAKTERGTSQPADEGTRYRVGAVTKLFTAVLILQLAERAQITLDNKLAEFFPDEPDALAISYREMLAAGDSLAVDTRYRLLGRVAEKVYDRPYADIVKREIVNQLGLVRTYYAGTGVSTSLESEPYQWDGLAWARGAGADVQSLGGAGGMLSNATDLQTFMDAIVAGRIVTPHNATAMRDGGLGVRNFEVAGIAGFGERGEAGAFAARVYHFPAKGLTLAWTSNGSRVAVDEVIEEVLRLVVEKRRKPPRLTPATTPAG